MITTHKWVASLCSAMLSVAALPAMATAKPVTLHVYSAQQEHLIRPILEDFSKQTGITIELATGDDASLIARLEQEGKKSNADILLAADIGNIYKAKERGLLKSIDSDVLNSKIPAHLRDAKDGQWYGLTTRARAIFYNKDMLSKEQAPQNYAELADPKWKGKLLIRSSSNIYNQSLTSAYILHNGEQAAQAWVSGIVANMARSPQGGDSDQLRALAAGEGSIAVANTYYYGRMLSGEEPNSELVKQKVGVIFPNDIDKDTGKQAFGTHINIRGGGVTASTDQPEAAQKLMEYLVGEKAQVFFSVKNHEFPVVSSVEKPDILKQWGHFTADDLPLEQVGAGNKKATALMLKGGWN